MKRDTVVIGGSSGSLQAIRSILRGIAADADVSVFVVMHLSPLFPSNLPAILERDSPFKVHHPYNGEIAQPGHVYIAPPDRHLVIDEDRIGLTNAPRENRVRPAVDVLFRSASLGRGPRVIGVVLSGSLYDGAAGMVDVKRRGGITIVQDPEEAEAAGMPTASIERAPVDFVLRADEIAPRINELLGTVAPAPAIAGRVVAAVERDSYGVTCPDCWGILHQNDHEGVPSFECRVGHRFSESALLAAQTDGVESALWMAVRALEEHADISQRVAKRATEAGRAASARRMSQEAHDAAFRAELIRRLLEPLYTGGDAGEPVGTRDSE